MTHDYTLLPFLSSKKLVTGFLLLLCLLMASYGPMTTYSSAQSATSVQLQELKQKITTEINRRITSYQKTLDAMGVSVGAVSSSDTTTTLPTDLKSKTKQFLQKLVDELGALKQKVTKTTSLGTLKGLAQNVDAQYSLGQLTQVQATTTQVVETMTGVLADLKSALSGIQDQVALAKGCLQAVKDGKLKNADQETQCAKLNVTTSDAADQAQAQADGTSSMITTITSIIASSVALLNTLTSQYTNLTDGLGGLGSLSNLSGGATGSTSLAGLNGIQSNITGLMTSFTAITSQLDISNMMSANALAGLSSLNDLITL